MSTTMKTIKFGKDGKVYAVNVWAVERSGELTENGTVIDFGGAFDKGLTEINAVMRGVEGINADYFYIGINGQKTGFISGGYIYNSGINIKLNKIGNLWDVDIYGANGSVGNAVTYVQTLLDGVSEVTDLSIEAYSDAAPFGAGTKYALEGR